MPSGTRMMASFTMPALVTITISAVRSATGTSCTWRMRSVPSFGATITEVYFVASDSTPAALRITLSICLDLATRCSCMRSRSSLESFTVFIR